jgi:hypothetical protein
MLVGDGKGVVSFVEGLHVATMFKELRIAEASSHDLQLDRILAAHESRPSAPADCL